MDEAPYLDLAGHIPRGGKCSSESKRGDAVERKLLWLSAEEAADMGSLTKMGEMRPRRVVGYSIFKAVLNRYVGGGG